MKKKLTQREIAAYRRRQHMMMLADNGGEEPEPQWNMRVVAHPDEGYELPQTTGNFTLVKQDGDTYYYQHDGSSSTGDSVLYGYAQISVRWEITDVTFKDCEHITSIGNEFIQLCTNLTEIDLSPLSNVSTIGSYFLGGCRILESIDLSPLSNVSTIGSSFLGGCKNLTEIDLSPLSKLTSINTAFLYACTNLTEIDLSPLSNVSTIGSSFLDGCTNLTEIDLSPLSNVSTIGSYFLRQTSITSLKLPWTTIPTTQAIGFMYRVPSTCTIEVPCEALSAYKTTTPWSNRADYIIGDC